MAGYMGKQRNEGKVCSLEAIHSGAWEAHRNPGFTHVDRHEGLDAHHRRVVGYAAVCRRLEHLKAGLAGRVELRVPCVDTESAGGDNWERAPATL